MTQITHTPTVDELIIALEQLDAAGKIELETYDDGHEEIYSFRILGGQAEHIWHHFVEFVTFGKGDRWLAFRQSYNQNNGTCKRSVRQGLAIADRVLRMAAELTK